MESLERNRVFRTEELGQLRTDIGTILDCAVDISGEYDRECDRVRQLLERVPAEAKNWSASASMQILPSSFVYSRYEEQRREADNYLVRAISDIPYKDAEGAQVLSLITEETTETIREMQELEGMLSAGALNLSLEAFRKQVDYCCSRDSDPDRQRLLDFKLRTLGLWDGTVLTGDPVNVLNGDFVFDSTDLQIRGVPFLYFTRTYNSRNRRKGMLGRGWSTSYDYSLQEENDHTIVITLPDGNMDIFEKYGNSYRGQEQADKGNMQLEKTAEGWIYRLEERSIHFTQTGRAASIQTLRGQGVALSYGEDGSIQRVESSSGRYLIFSYTDGKLAAVRDDTGRQVSYTYEGKHLVKVTDPMGGEETYRYGSSNSIEEKTDRNGNSIQNQYDQLHRVTKQTLPDGGTIRYRYDDKRHFSEVEYQDGHKTRYRYRPSSRQIITTDEHNREKEEVLSAAIPDISSLFRDQTDIWQEDAEGRITELAGMTITYGENGCPAVMISPDGAVSTFTYDACNRIVSRTDGREYTTSYRYDARDRLVQINYPDGSYRSCGYDKENNVTFLKQENGEVYTLCYDSSSRLCEIADSRENRTQITYDSCGKLKRIQTPDGSIRDYEWTDNAETETGNAETGYAEAETDTGNTAPVWPPLEEYDRAGNVIKRRYPDGREEQYTYDCRNRITSCTSPDGGIWKLRYGADGRCISKTDPYGGEVQFCYDEDGYPTGVTDQLGHFHPVHTRRLRVEQRDGNAGISGDAIKPETEQEKGPVPDYTVGSLEKYPEDNVEDVRDASGRLCERSYPGGIHSSYRYGQNGRIRSICHTDREGVLEELVYTYDITGNCTQLHKTRRGHDEESGEYGYQYDSLGRLTGVSRNGEAIRSYTYDVLGNRTKKCVQENGIWYNVPELHSGTSELSVCPSAHRLWYTEENGEPPVIPPVTVTCYQADRDKQEYLIKKDGQEYQLLCNTLPHSLYTDGQTRYLLTDHLGSILRVMTEEGRTEEVYGYDEYGVTTTGSPHIAGYGGYPVAGPDLYITGHRYYQARSGRFLSPDNWGGILDNPQTFNPYIYAADNPVRYRDATGQYPTESPLFPTRLETGQDAGKETFDFPEENSVRAGTSGIHKGHTGEAVYQETFLDWLNSSVDGLMHSSYGDQSSASMMFTAAMMSPISVAGMYLTEMVLGKKGPVEALQSVQERFRGRETAYLKEIPTQLYGMLTLPDTVFAILDRAKTEGVWNTFSGICNGMIDGVVDMGHTYLNGTAEQRGEIEGKAQLLLAEYLLAKYSKGSEPCKAVEKVDDAVEGGNGSKLQEVFDTADNYNLSDDTFNNHILERHGANSTYSNKSHFNADFDIKAGIDSTLKGDNFIVKSNTGDRSGYIFEQTFKDAIGVNSKGKSIYTLKVVIDESGNVITAFPKK